MFTQRFGLEWDVIATRITLPLSPEGWRKVGDKWGNKWIKCGWCWGKLSCERKYSNVGGAFLGGAFLALRTGVEFIIYYFTEEYSRTFHNFHLLPSCSIGFWEFPLCDFTSQVWLLVTFQNILQPSILFSNLLSCSVVPSGMFCLVPACSGIFLVYSCSYLIFPCSLSNLIKTYLILSWPILSDCPYLILSYSKYHK